MEIVHEFSNKRKSIGNIGLLKIRDKWGDVYRPIENKVRVLH